MAGRGKDACAQFEPVVAYCTKFFDASRATFTAEYRSDFQRQTLAISANGEYGACLVTWEILPSDLSADGMKDGLRYLQLSADLARNALGVRHPLTQQRQSILETMRGMSLDRTGRRGSEASE